MKAPNVEKEADFTEPAPSDQSGSTNQTPIGHAALLAGLQTPSNDGEKGKRSSDVSKKEFDSMMQA